MSIDKTCHGDLQGTSVGQMLAFRSGVDGSAGYVAMERVTASLGGREGSFTLQHSGLMDKGAQSLTSSSCRIPLRRSWRDKWASASTNSITARSCDEWAPALRMRLPLRE
jgi:hypothetical protein